MKLAALLVVFALLFPVAVANRCKGEASFAIESCACTVKNRIDAGWAQSKVLSAYYARDVVATPAEVQQVKDILDGVVACDSNLYFMYGLGDIKALGLERFKPALIVREGNREVRFYSHWFRGE